MSKKQLNAAIRNSVRNYVFTNGKSPVKAVVDYVVRHISDSRVTRHRVCGNISALCCKFGQLTCVNSELF